MRKLSKQDIVELLPLLVAVCLFIVIFVVSRNIPDEVLHAFIHRAGIFAPALWILLSLITYVAAPLSSTPLLLVGYYAFGSMVILYAVMVSAIGSIINFMIARRYGREVVVRLVGHKSLRRMDSITNNYGAGTLFALRVFLASFHEVISYAVGLTTMSFRTYYAVTVVAYIPSLLLWYGVSRLTMDPVLFTVYSIVVSTGLSAVFFLYRFISWRLHRHD